jgi:hypothetical protein
MSPQGDQMLSNSNAGSGKSQSFDENVHLAAIHAGQAKLYMARALRMADGKRSRVIRVLEILAAAMQRAVESLQHLRYGVAR